MTYRLVYAPWLRAVMNKILPNWSAITIGHTIFTGSPTVSDSLLRHELVHVAQWERYGILFPTLYLWASIAAVLSGQGWYAGNRYEQEARDAD